MEQVLTLNVSLLSTDKLKSTLALNSAALSPKALFINCVAVCSWTEAGTRECKISKAGKGSENKTKFCNTCMFSSTEKIHYETVLFVEYNR